MNKLALYKMICMSTSGFANLHRQFIDKFMSLPREIVEVKFQRSVQK